MTLNACKIGALLDKHSFKDMMKVEKGWFVHFFR
jgi:hypothetical protein